MELHPDLEKTGEKTLVLLAQAEEPRLVQPLGLPQEYFELELSPSGNMTGWKLTAEGRAAQKRVVQAKLAGLRDALKKLG